MGPAQELPVIVAVVDGPRRIDALLARIEPAFKEGEITLERAHVVLYRGEGDEREAPPPEIDVIASQDRSAALGVKTMKVPEDGVLLRIFMGEADRELAAWTLFLNRGPAARCGSCCS